MIRNQRSNIEHGQQPKELKMSPSVQILRVGL